jgi:YVTN family beta-propeller protein
MKTRILLVLGAALALLALTAAAPAAADPPIPDTSAWQALPPPPGGSVNALAASPDFSADRTLLAGTDYGVYLSSDGGGSWVTLSVAIAPTRLILSPDYPTDPTVFAVTDATRESYDVLYRSVDGGVNWLPVWYGGAVHDLALSPDFAVDGTAFLAVSLFPGQVLRSNDFGVTWQALPDPMDLEPVLHLAVSPNFPADHTLFVAGYGPMHRSTDGGASWQRLNAAGPNYSLAISPHYATDRTVWAVYREMEGSAMQPEAGVIRSTDGGNTWSNVTAGLDGNYNQNYRSLAPDPTGEAVYLALTGPQWDPRFPPRVYRSDNGGQRWAPQETLPGGAPSQVLALGPLPHVFALAEGAVYRHTATCYEALADGGFETGPELLPYPSIARAWETPSTPLPAGYAEDIRYAGAFALRTGTGPAGPNIYSYSSVRQWVSIPADADDATLTFWRYPTLGDLAAVGTAEVDAADLLAASPDVADFQYLLAVFDDGSLETLRTWRDNSQTWILTEVDLRAYAGRSFWLHFGTFNNGTGGRSGMVLDEVGLRICLRTPLQPARQYLPLLLRDHATPSQPASQLIVNGYAATRLMGDYRTPDRYATSMAGLHRKIGAGEWALVNSAPPRPRLVFSPANSSVAWAGRLPACLMGGNDEPMVKSSNGGQTWAELPAGLNLQPIAAHPSDANRVYALGCDGPYLSRDGGATWQLQDAALWHLYFVSDIAPVDPVWSTVFASGVSEGGGGMVARSTDGGQTWLQVTPLYADIWWITDVWVDPTNPQRVYFLEPNGVWRSTDGGDTWQRFTAGLEDVLYQDGRAVYGLFEIVSRLDDPSRLYLGTAAGLYESTDYGVTWHKRSGYAWDHQRVDGLLAEGASGLWVHSPEGVFYLAHGAATPTPTPTPTATSTATPTPTATATATPTATGTATPTATATPQLPAGCSQRLANGDFEGSAGWVIRSNPVLAAYVNAPVHGGLRAMRSGIPAGGANVESYSPFDQAITIPAGYQATLTFWRHTTWGDGTAASLSAAAPDPSTLPATLDELGRTPLGADFFYVIAIRPDNSIIWLLTERVDNPAWRQASVLMTPWAGQSLRIQFGTYNNGAGGISRTVVDDASLVACLPAVTPTHTFTPTPTRTATPSPTLHPSVTPSWTPTPTPIPTATPGAVPTPYWAGQLNLPAGSRPHGLAVNAAGNRIYVAFHGVNHSGRTLGVVNETLSLQAQIDLGPAAQGPNGVAVIPGSGRVVVANRQTANASVIDPVAGALVQHIPANLLPDGVLIAGDHGYIANYGNDTVTVFNPATLAVIRTLYGVGHEPALLAGDEASGDVFLTAHGSDQVFYLRDGQVIGQWNGVIAPYGVSYDPAGRRLYVANRGMAHTVTVIDVYLDQIVGTIAVGREPYVLLVNPASGHLFVACDDEVKVYDTFDWSPVTSIPVPPGATEGIAFEPRLSKVFVASAASDALTAIQDQGPAQVVFVSDRDDNGEIYRMLPDGRRQARLTFTADAWEGAPAGSPDGRWIAYERVDIDSGNPGQIWLMSRDGRGAVMLTDGPFDNMHPTWSADSRKIALASNRDGDWDIYVLDLATRDLVKLTDDAWYDVQPDWSKATGRIAFTSNRHTGQGEIFTMAADGSDVRRLTTNANGDASPSWSPGGERVAFWGSRPQGQGLYTVRSDGSDVRLVAPQALRPGGPAWGFAGEAIVFSGYRRGSGYSEIMRMEADGSGLALLTNNEVDFEYAPGWLAGW